MGYGNNIYGWGIPPASTRSEGNHITLAGIYPYVLAEPRADARISMTLIDMALVDGSQTKRIFCAYEGYDTGILSALIDITADLSTAVMYREGTYVWYRTVSTDPTDWCPVVIYYPAAYGFSARKAIYWLASGYASGKRIAQYDYATQQVSMLSIATGDYSYVSLQGGDNRQAAKFCLVAEAVQNGGMQHNVNYYDKPTYYGNSAPSLYATFTNFSRPTVMVESGNSFGSPIREINMLSTGDSYWYKCPSSGSIAAIGANTAAMMTREKVGTGERASMAVRTTTVPSKIERYSGTGMLQKTDAITVNTRHHCFWIDKTGLEQSLTFDFGHSSVERIDTLESEHTICAVRVDAPLTGTFFVKQSDSVKKAVALLIQHQGNAFPVKHAFSWSRISTETMHDVQTGDIVLFQIPSEANCIRGYMEYSLARVGLTKSDSMQIYEEEAIVPAQNRLSVYPNPFNPSTTIVVEIVKPGNAVLEVYDLLGRKVVEIFSGLLTGHQNIFPFDGSRLPSGVYIVRLSCGQSMVTQRLLLAK